MPRWLVTWTQTAEWCVWSEDAAELLRAVRGVRPCDIDWDDLVTDEYLLPAGAANDVDDVVVDGELLAPADAEAASRERLAAELEDRGRFACPTCGETISTEGCSPGTGRIACPACGVRLDADDLRSLFSPPRDDRTLDLW